MRSFLESNNIEFENNKIKLKQTTKSVKIDIGLSYNAPQAEQWFKHQTDLQVFGFEPVPENIKSIISGPKKRHPSHGDPLSFKYIQNKDFNLIPCALSNNKKKEEMNFYVTSRDTGCSSLFQPKANHVGPTKQVIKVPVFSLKHFFDLFPWDKMPIIEYIKIDAQGSDLNILKGAEHYLQERVVFITAEPDGFQYTGAEDSTVNSIVNYMKSIGFHHVRHRNTQDPTFLNKKYMDKQKIHISQY